MSHDGSHLKMSITCIRYLRVCVARTALGDGFPNIDSWTSKHYEAYVRYLNDRPLINYILRYLKYHIGCSCQIADVSYQISQLVEELLVSGNPAAKLFDHWASSNLSELETRFDCELASESGLFKDRLLHTAAYMVCPSVAEGLFLAGAQVDVRLQDKTPLIVSAERGCDAIIQLLIDWNANKGATG
jgi:hypothetical protein